MGEIILIIAVVFVLSAIIQLIKAVCMIITGIFMEIKNFVTEHYKIIFVLLGTGGMIAGLFVYVRLSEEPFGFVFKAWRYLTYKNDIVIALTGLVLTFFISFIYGTGKRYFLTKISQKYSPKMTWCMDTFSYEILIISGVIFKGDLLLNNLFAVCFLLYEAYLLVLRIFLLSDTQLHKLTRKMVCIFSDFAVIQYLVALIKIPVKICNYVFLTRIPYYYISDFLIAAIDILLLLCIADIVRHALPVRMYINKAGIFDFGEIAAKCKDKCKKDYVLAVLNAMKSVFIESWMAEDEWMTKRYLAFFKKETGRHRYSEDVEKDYKYSLHSHTFREIYMKMYEHFYGIGLDFTPTSEERNEHAYHKKDPVFRMMRYQIQEHPVLNEKWDSINNYLLYWNQLLKSLKKDDKKYKMVLYKYICSMCNSKSQYEKLKNMVSRKKYGLKKLVIRRRDYRVLMLLEALYFAKLTGQEESFKFEGLEKLSERMKIKPDRLYYIYSYFDNGILRLDAEKLKKTDDEYQAKYHDKMPSFFVKQLLENQQYEKKEEVHIGVCATVSSGKSTFLNTFLGQELMPSKMTACTARMSVVRINRNMDRPVSVIENKTAKNDYIMVLTPETAKELNTDENVKSLLTEMHLSYFDQAHKILYFHDSPGVNNSMNAEHHDTTIRFIKEEKPDWLLILIDAQQDTVNDNVVFLKEVRAYMSRPENVIFIYNKVDCLNEDDGDELDENLEEIRNMIREQGFVNPKIFPTSAMAAQLFEQVLNGRKIEMERLFFKCYDFFRKESNDMTKYFPEEIGMVKSRKYEVMKKDEKISLKGKELEKGDVLEAFYRTGFLAIAEWILQYVTGKEAENL